ncbi:MAG TPA: class I SAM-dependent methyltransferase [Baekduia sp.]|uniref:class I SAM-dependent methyltransferase n=1 Tax=Baekduia sp. TaxID=2600305 RepID=UPI002C1AE53C|nr:class I SAM-dependent methyltransferase [Baekduia sp.]HMJ34365.1 class I SAM-dependent methyltransferase [Baekduia sp.]
MDTPPLPPMSLAERVGSLADADDPWTTFDLHGAGARAAIEAALGEDWTWEGKAVLDFGAGIGRTLRHFVPELEIADFHACDIDVESVQWLQQNFPAVQSFTNEEMPPIDRPAETFDVIYAVSVFTHLLDSWAEWLLEMRRLLKPGGVLVASFMTAADYDWLPGTPYDDERMGMFGWAAGQPWDKGGPMVMHSPWWITEHWGRAMDVVRFVPSGEGDPWFIHGLAVLRHPGTPAPAVTDLAPPGDDPREAAALSHNLDFVQREAGRLRFDLEWLLDEKTRLEREAAARTTPGNDEASRPGGALGVLRRLRR